MSKEGNALVRYLWCEAAMHAVGRDPELKRFYRRKLMQKGMGKATIAAARKLGVRLWIMMRDEIDYQEFCRRGQLRQRCLIRTMVACRIEFVTADAAGGATVFHRSATRGIVNHRNN